MSETARLITLDPAHFHAALVQKEIVPGVDRRVHVYAPLGPDLAAHLGRVAAFNARPDNPCSWELEVHAAPDFLERLLRERPGNVVVLSGRNRRKIDYLLAAVKAGLNVLADKPWVLEPADLPKLEAALAAADAQGLVAYDIMTERCEITSLLQRELVHDPDVFGAAVPGSEQEPAVFMESVHYLMKLVAGVPNRRPAWFFDVAEQGEGLADVGTHLVDLVFWMLFPGRPIDRRDLIIVSARRWPTELSVADFHRVTGEPDFPPSLAGQVRGGRLHYYCNNLVSYTVRGVHVKLNVLWDFEAPPGAGDSHRAVVRGSRSRVEVRQAGEAGHLPQLYVVPNKDQDRNAIAAALRKKAVALQDRYEGLRVEEVGAELRVRIPERYRVGHEAHFAEVTRQFLAYLQRPGDVPAWERANLLAKYHLTTRAVAGSR